jgi:hypothetical protein
VEERIKALEDFSQISTALAIQVESSQRRMSARQARMEERQRQMVEQLGQMEERQRQIEEDQRQIEEDQQLADESQRRTAELVQQLVQAAAIIQAEIIRIDETRP